MEPIYDDNNSTTVGGEEQYEGTISTAAEKESQYEVAASLQNIPVYTQLNHMDMDQQTHVKQLDSEQTHCKQLDSEQIHVKQSDSEQIHAKQPDSEQTHVKQPDNEQAHVMQPDSKQIQVKQPHSAQNPDWKSSLEDCNGCSTNLDSGGTVTLGPQMICQQEMSDPTAPYCSEKYAEISTYEAIHENAVDGLYEDIADERNAGITLDSIQYSMTPSKKKKVLWILMSVILMIGLFSGSIVYIMKYTEAEPSYSSMPVLLLAEKLELHLISLNNRDYTDVVLPLSDIRQAMAIDYDHVEDHVYWTDVETRTISRAHSDGSGQEIVVSGVESPQGVAVNCISRNLYWTDTDANHIEASRLNGTSRRVLLSEDLDKPRAITLDPYNGYIYWTAWGKQPKIERAFLDGSQRMQLVNTSIEWPIGLALDFVEKKLYWGDSRTDRIEVINMDGTNRTILLSGSDVLQYIYGLTLLGDYIYWTDAFFVTIERMHKHNVKDKVTIVDSLENPRGLKAVDMYRITEWQGCHGILLLAQKSDLHLVSLTNHNHTDAVLQVSDVRNAMAIDYDHVEDYVYWTDVGTKAISRAHLNGSGQEIVVGSGVESPQGVAVDCISRNLYWTDTKTNYIGVSRLDGTSRRVLLSEDLDQPRAIALDHYNRCIYWTAWGKHPKIEHAFLDGSQRVQLVHESIEWPIGLALDLVEKKLYWGDARTDRIEVINMDGTDRRILLQGFEVLQHIYGLTLLGDYIYWNDVFNGTIERMHKHNVEDRMSIVDYFVNSRGLKAVSVYGISNGPGEK